jgi:hypothetical protein
MDAADGYIPQPGNSPSPSLVARFGDDVGGRHGGLSWGTGRLASDLLRYDVLARIVAAAVVAGVVTGAVWFKEAVWHNGRTMLDQPGGYVILGGMWLIGSVVVFFRLR